MADLLAASLVVCWSHDAASESLTSSTGACEQPDLQNGLRARACLKLSFAPGCPFALPCDSKASSGRSRSDAPARDCSCLPRGAQQPKAHTDVGRQWVVNGSTMGSYEKKNLARLPLSVGRYVGPPYQNQCTLPALPGRLVISNVESGLWVMSSTLELS